MPTSDKAHKINDLWALFFFLVSPRRQTNGTAETNATNIQVNVI